MGYKEFIHNKSNLTENFGFEALWIPDFLFDFQKALVEWELKKGRGGRDPSFKISFRIGFGGNTEQLESSLRLLVLRIENFFTQ